MFFLSGLPDGSGPAAYSESSSGPPFPASEKAAQAAAAAGITIYGIGLNTNGVISAQQYQYLYDISYTQTGGNAYTTTSASQISPIIQNIARQLVQLR
jgi:hypothetical protein